MIGYPIAFCQVLTNENRRVITYVGNGFNKVRRREEGLKSLYRVFSAGGGGDEGSNKRMRCRLSVLHVRV